MPAPDTRHLRLLLFAVFAVLLAALLWFLFGALNGALTLWRELQQLPTWLSALIGALVLALIGGGGWIGWRLLRPRKRVPRAVIAPTRVGVQQRVASLRDIGADTRALENELLELDRRRHESECHVALFGEISAGKSSVLRALAPRAEVATDVLGGTTAHVAQHRGMLPDGRVLVLADMPGTQEVGGREREQLARDEALRAHAVIYVTDAEPTRQQDAELRWLHGFGKPLLLALNKSDRYRDDELPQLLGVLQERYRDLVAAVLAISAGGNETVQRLLPDGQRETAQRERAPRVDALLHALQAVTRSGAAALEPAREAAVLTGLGQKLAAAELAARAGAAVAVVDKYTRRAVLGALAAVAPGSDLLIQGALATGLVRELAALYAVPLKDLDLDAFLARAALTVRTATTVVLAIAGNALKAFPGLGTLGGGVLHAIAYGLVFDSLGRAVATTLAEQQRLDAEHAVGGLAQLLSEGGRERWRHVAELALSSARDAEDKPP
jgi:GTP-binding protein EngB required for normal cell division